jgi:hypothetical protein
MPVVSINGILQAFAEIEQLLGIVNRSKVEVPQVGYHPQLGPIQTSNTCMVEVDGKLVRRCAAVQGIASIPILWNALPRPSAKPSTARELVIEPPGPFSLLAQFRRKELHPNVPLINRSLRFLGNQLKLNSGPGPVH